MMKIFEKSLFIFFFFKLVFHSNLVGQVTENRIEVLCSGISQQIGIDPIPGNTYTWVPDFYVSNSTISNPIVSLENSSPDSLDYNLIMREFNSNGTLIRIIFFTARVAPISLYSITILEADICPGDTVFLHRDYQWGSNFTIGPNMNAGYIIEDSTYFFYPTDSTQYTISYNDTAACLLQLRNIEIYLHDAVNASITSNDTVFCVTDTLAYTFLLQPPGGSLLGNGIDENGVFIPQLAGGGRQTLIYSQSNAGCSATDSIHINVLDQSGVVLADVPNLCGNLEAFEINYGSPSGGVYLLDGLTSDSIISSMLSPGPHNLLYTVSLGEDCEFSVSDVFNVIPVPSKPQITPAGPTLFCEGDSVKLFCTNFTRYLWSTGDTTQSIWASASGQYSVKIISNTGCISDTVSINIIEAPPLIINLIAKTYSDTFNISTYNATDGEIYLILPETFAPYAIYWSSGVENTDTLSGIGAGYYYVDVTNSAGCYANDSIRLIQPDSIPLSVSPEYSDLSFPNAFTPNGDGLNDFYVIKNLFPDHSNNTFRVWDISRRLVFQMENYNNQWNGKDNHGNQLPAGTYFLIFQIPKLDLTAKSFIDLRYE
jgi:gliding motility-associated-like protein